MDSVALYENKNIMAGKDAQQRYQKASGVLFGADQPYIEGRGCRNKSSQRYSRKIRPENQKNRGI
jgi:hypothetical protein